MARPSSDVEKIVDDEIMDFIDDNEQCFVKEQKFQSASSKDTSSESSESSPSRKKFRKTESSNANDIDTDTSSSNVDPNLKLRSLDILQVEKEINVLVRLRCLLKIDKNTKSYVGKVLTSVHCESTKDSTTEDRENPENHSNSSTMNSQIVKIDSRSTKSSAKKNVEVSSITNDDEWKNVNLLTTTMMNFADAKLYEKNNLHDTETFLPAERPREKIHFSTPEVEKKYRNIVDNRSTFDNEIMTIDDETRKNTICPSSSKKRKLSSEMFVATPEISEFTEKETIAILGPIPSANSRLFDGMSFVVASVSRDYIDPHRLETIESGADAENEQQWTDVPFVRDRIVAQLKAGGGRFYESFEHVPTEKYETTKLITNLPNLTAKSLLCLSVGIKAYNHHWIIRCCRENKIVNPAEDQLPAGWSVIKESYVEMFERPSQKPFLSSLPVVVVIPMHPNRQQFISFWGKICENAGATVRLIEKQTDDFMEGTVVLWHSLCPSWLIKKAKDWDIPVVSTQWTIQCLIEGQICSYDAHPSFDYNYVKNPLCSSDI